MRGVPRNICIAYLNRSTHLFVTNRQTDRWTEKVIHTLRLLMQVTRSIKRKTYLLDMERLLLDDFTDFDSDSFISFSSLSSSASSSLAASLPFTDLC